MIRWSSSANANNSNNSRKVSSTGANDNNNANNGNYFAPDYSANEKYERTQYMASYKVDISKASKSEPSASKTIDAERNKFPAERQTETTQHRVCKLTSLIKNEERTHRGVGYKNSVSRFHILQLSKCRKLGKELFNGTYRTKIGETFPIYEPKFRIVTSTPYRDRIPQSSFCKNVIYEQVVPHLIDNNLACRKGGGVDKARRIFKDILKRAKESDVCVCTDIKSYFASIDHEIQCDTFFEFLDDNDEWARWYYKDIINANGEKVGLPLGSEIDQLSAVMLPHKIDERLDDGNYERYMDDIRYVTNKENAVKVMGKIDEAFNKTLKLQLNKKKSYIVSVMKPITFLGFTYLKHKNGKVTMKRIRQKYRNEKRKLLKMKRAGIPLKRIGDHLRSARATMQKGARADLKKFDKYIKQLFGDQIMDIIKNNIKEEVHQKEQDSVMQGVKETDEHSNAMNAKIRECGITPSQEFAVLRKTIEKLCSIAKAEGHTFPEFDEHCKKIEEALEECEKK